MSADGFNPCPLAMERHTDDVCDEVICTTRVIAKDWRSDVEYEACAACARAFDNWEPSDDQLANRHGVEGGVGYRDEDTAAYRERLRDAGRR